MRMSARAKWKSDRIQVLFHSWHLIFFSRVWLFPCYLTLCNAFQKIPWRWECSHNNGQKLKECVILSKWRVTLKSSGLCQLRFQNFFSHKSFECFHEGNQHVSNSNCSLSSFFCGIFKGRIEQLIFVFLFSSFLLGVSCRLCYKKKKQNCDIYLYF